MLKIKWKCFINFKLLIITIWKPNFFSVKRKNIFSASRVTRRQKAKRQRRQIKRSVRLVTMRWRHGGHDVIGVRPAGVRGGEKVQLPHMEGADVQAVSRLHTQRRLRHIRVLLPHRTGRFVCSFIYIYVLFIFYIILK